MSENLTMQYGEFRVTMTLQRDLYPKAAVYGAAYQFIERCYVFLDAPQPGYLSVELKSRDSIDQAGLEALAGEFCNELLAHAFRFEIAEQNKDLLEAIVAQSMGSTSVPAEPPQAAAPPTFDLSELEALDLDDEPFEDPLGIAVSWEDKYGKKKKTGTDGE
ncbi:MAG: His-Xaa-Ser system protein HxsD [Myxococcota bacterium]|nr:His-Xaa-Ser system protein HxsD [Myxococcota bacterium]